MPRCARIWNYEFVREYLDTYKFDSVTFWVSCLTPQEKIGHAMEFYTNLSRDYLKKKVRPLLSCGIMPCAMTDAQFGLLAKIGNQFGRCTPHLGVLPDGRVCHCEEMAMLPGPNLSMYCEEMAMLPGPNLSMFRTERELQKFYYDVFRDLQWTMDVCPECKQCICMTGGSCTGLSMAMKAHKMLEDFDKYKKRIAEEHGELSEDERMDLLWQMTKVCLILALYTDAIEWLDYNTIRTIPYMGPLKPVMLMEFPDCDDDYLVGASTDGAPIYSSDNVPEEPVRHECLEDYWLIDDDGEKKLPDPIIMYPLNI